MATCYQLDLGVSQKQGGPNMAGALLRFPLNPTKKKTARLYGPAAPGEIRSSELKHPASPMNG